MADQPAWTAGFDDARAFQRERMLAATPAQRLAWLEEAIVLACRSGALPRPALAAEQPAGYHRSTGCSSPRSPD